MIVWGGCQEHECRINTHTGGRYNPSTDSWTATSTAGVIEAGISIRWWTGNEIIVWGGQTAENGYTHIGGRHGSQPGNNAPRPTPTATACNRTAP
ncbi:MAG: hypothetical protein IPL78_34710 [Chloroflexi bacterium]|nr:hypothetical protein [Chloroflexota bacterium]